MSETNKRKAWVDGLRAVALLLVILGHQFDRSVPFGTFTNPIKIPLFFAVSGYVFTGERRPFPLFLRNLTLHIMVPWLIIVLLKALFLIPLSGTAAMRASLLEAWNGFALWYLPCCFFAEIIWYPIVRYLKRPARIAAAAVLCCLAGFFMAWLGILNVLMINRAFVAQFFLLIGLLFRECESRLAALRWRALAAIALVYVGLCLVSIAVWPRGMMDIHLNRYYNLPFCFLLICAGCFSMLLIGSRLSRAPRALLFIGQNTLLIYMTHGAVIRAIDVLLRRAGVAPDSVLLALLNTILGCCVCSAIAVFVNRFIPVLAGRYRPGETPAVRLPQWRRAAR